VLLWPDLKDLLALVDIRGRCGALKQRVDEVGGDCYTVLGGF
jgi:hypothetical protein